MGTDEIMNVLGNKKCLYASDAYSSSEAALSDLDQKGLTESEGENEERTTRHASKVPKANQG